MFKCAVLKKSFLGDKFCHNVRCFQITQNYKAFLHFFLHETLQLLYILRYGCGPKRDGHSNMVYLAYIARYFLPYFRPKSPKIAIFYIFTSFCNHHYYVKNVYKQLINLFFELAC